MGRWGRGEQEGEAGRVWRGGEQGFRASTARVQASQALTVAVAHAAQLAPNDAVLLVHQVKPLALVVRPGRGCCSRVRSGGVGRRHWRRRRRTAGQAVWRSRCDPTPWPRLVLAGAAGGGAGELRRVGERAKRGRLGVQRGAALDARAGLASNPTSWGVQLSLPGPQQPVCMGRGRKLLANECSRQPFQAHCAATARRQRLTPPGKRPAPASASPLGSDSAQPQVRPACPAACPDGTGQLAGSPEAAQRRHCQLPPVAAAAARPTLCAALLFLA